MTSAKTAILAAMLCSAALHAAPARAGLRGDVTDYGETTAEQGRPARPTHDEHTITPRTTITGIQFVDRTSSLPAELCLRFGVLVRLISDPGEQLPSQLLVVVTHPRITRPDEAFSTEDSFPTPVIGDSLYAGWTFDNPWEQQLGEWIVAFTYKGQVIASKAFTVTGPTSTGSRCPPKPVS